MERFQQFSVREEEETVLAYLHRMVESGFRLIGGSQEVAFNWKDPLACIPCKVEEGYRLLHWSR